MSDLTITGYELAMAVSGIGLVLMGGIIVGKKIIEKRKVNQNTNEKTSFSIAGRTKYKEVDVFSWTGPLTKLGLAVSCTFCLLAFSWTKFDDPVFIPEGADILEDIIEIDIPRTDIIPPQPPPPPPPPVIEVVEDEVVEDVPEFIDQTVEADTRVEVVKPVVTEKKEVPPPPPPPIIEETEEEIFKVVEQMPMFKGCENEKDKKAMKTCATQKLLKFVYKNIKYPAIARENGIEGTAVINFVVDKDGSIEQAKILKNPGAGTGEEALRVINKMPDWNPGMQRGKAVKVYFNLPIKFALQ